MIRIFEHGLTIPPEAMDGNGHVNNVVYVRWIQDAAVYHSWESGVTREVYRELRSTWVIRTHHIDYLRPCYAGEKIAVLTWISSFKRMRCARKFRIIRLDDGVELARAKTEFVYINAESGRPKTVDSRVAEGFEVVPDEEANAFVPEREPLTQGAE